MRLIHFISNARPRKIKVGIRFSFDTLFILDFYVCVGIEENLVLNQEVIFRLLQYVYYMIMVGIMKSEVRQYREFEG